MRTLVLLSALAFLALPEPGTAQIPEGRNSLFKDGRARLAEVRARDQQDALVLIASERGQNQRVADLITEWGGTIHFRSDDVDYIRGRVPTERVEELVRHEAVYTLDLSDVPPPESEDDEEEEDDTSAPRVGGDEDRPWFRAAMGAGGPRGAYLGASSDTLRAWPPVWSDYPLTNRYDPVSSMNGLEFLRENPTFDGRGVTTAMIDRNMDPLLPELQHALTLNGEPVHKVAAYMSATDRTEEPDDRWVPMDSVVTATNRRITYGEDEYGAPRDGTFRMGILPRGGFVSGIITPDAEEPDSTDFAVLWDEESDDVWVDTQRDRSFANEQVLTDFSVRPEFGVIGEDDPETDIRESIGYAIQIRKDRNEVGVLLGTESHATLVIGAAVASRGENGRFNGVAPGARVANVDEGCKGYGQTEAVILAFQNPEVDIAFLEQCSNITRPYLIRDGRLTTTEIYSRLIDEYGKTLMVPTHNYPVLGAPDDFVSARGALGIGGHESRDNYFVNAGTRVEHRHNLLMTGGYGPMGDGALKPDVIAPSNHVSTALGFQPGRTRPGLFTLPPGYTTAGGTSTATPTATGAVMLLMSAARQSGIDFDNRRIKHAVTMSAHYVPHLPAYKQGNGVVDISAAWEVLQALDTTSMVVDIQTRAPVRHEWSHLLPTPHEGVSIYEREGWAPGDQGTRVMTYTRTSGPSEPITFQVGWIGNEGAFSAPATLTLPLNEPTPLPVTIEPDTAGVHSALLTLDHSSVPGGVHRSMVTVLAGQPLTAEAGYTHEKELEVPRPGMHSVFYAIPEGTQLLRIDLDAPERPLALAVAEPDTRGVSGLGGAGSTGKRTVFVERPRAGVWEIRLSDIRDLQEWDWEQAQKDEPVPPTPATLTVSAIAVDFVDALAADDGGDGSATGEARATSRMADFTGGAVTLPLGAARSERRTIQEGEQQILEIEVPEGSTGLLVELGGFSSPDVDLDVYLHDCTDNHCNREGTGANLSGDEFIYVENPSAGTWKVVVDGFAVPADGASYDYLDVVFNPEFGTMATADVPGERKAGEPWQVRTNVWQASALPEGREAYSGFRLNIKTQGNSSESFQLGEVPVVPVR